MEYRIGRIVLAVAIAVGVIGVIDAEFLSSEAAGLEQQADPPYQNAQSFGELPRDRLRFVMQVYSNILGVNCEHCHVRGEWHLDDKPTKVTARAMIRMVMSSSETHFKDIGTASCWTCHRGDAKPQLNPDEATMAEFRANPPPVPEPIL